MIREAIIKLVNKHDLTYDEAFAVMTEILKGKTTPTQNAAFLAALTTKNTCSETEAEITGCAAALSSMTTKVDHAYRVTDIVGMGSESFDTSIVSSLVLAAAGAKVAKHGNRSGVSRNCEADCFEALGVKVEQSPEKASGLLDSIGTCFMLDSLYNTSTENVVPVIKELGFRTVFDILDPMINPAGPTYTVLGVNSEHLVLPLAHVLTALGVKKGMVVYGQDGTDGFTCSSPTTFCDFEGDDYSVYTTTPEEFGIPRHRREDLLSDSVEDTVRSAQAIIAGSRGPKYDMALIGSAAGLTVCGKASDLRDGIELADKLLSDGKVSELLDRYKAESNR